MDAVAILGVSVVLLTVLALALVAMTAVLAVRNRTLACEVRDRLADQKEAYIEQSVALQAMTKESVAAITTITHMMQSLVEDEKERSSTLVESFHRLEGHVDSWMHTLNQVLVRLDGKTHIYNTNSHSGQVNQGKHVHGDQQ